VVGEKSRIVCDHHCGLVAEGQDGRLERSERRSPRGTSELRQGWPKKLNMEAIMVRNFALLCSIPCVLVSSSFALAANDKDFLAQAITGDNSEIALGRLATMKGDEAVKEFGQTLMADHQNARDEADVTKRSKLSDELKDQKKDSEAKPYKDVRREHKEE